MSKRKRYAKRPARKGGAPNFKNLLDIIVPIYGEWEMAERSIESIAEACLGMNDGYRVIVIDNGTPVWRDGEGNEINPADQAIGIKDMLRNKDAFYRLEENQGYPGGVNYGLQKGTAPLVLIWTADVVMTPGSVTEAVKRMDDPEIGVVGAKLLFPRDESPHGPPGMVQHAGIAFDIEGRPFHILMGWPPDHPKVNQEREMAAVTGAWFLTRRELFAKTNGFPVIYGAGTFEDMDFCFSVREMGLKVLYCPTAWGYHYVGGSIRKGAHRPGFNLAMNSQIFRGRWAQALQWDEWKYW